jgi:hypothetical protein
MLNMPLYRASRAEHDDQLLLDKLSISLKYIYVLKIISFLSCRFMKTTPGWREGLLNPALQLRLG